MPYEMKFNLFGKFGFVDVFSILKQVKDKQPSLKGKVPDRADGWSVSDQKVLCDILFPSLLRNETPQSRLRHASSPFRGAFSQIKFTSKIKSSTN